VNYAVAHNILYLFKWDINEERNGELDKANTTGDFYTPITTHRKKK